MRIYKNLYRFAIYVALQIGIPNSRTAEETSPCLTAQLISNHLLNHRCMLMVALDSARVASTILTSLLEIGYHYQDDYTSSNSGKHKFFYSNFPFPSTEGCHLTLLQSLAYHC